MARFLVSTLVLFWAAGATHVQAQGTLRLRGPQKENLTHEPLLVTLRLEDGKASLPAGDKSATSVLRFEITPALKARSGVKPLVVESKIDGAAEPVRSRRYDLLEWYQFPSEGSFTVHAVLESAGKTMKSEAASFTIRRPDKGDKETAAVDRLHHLPWCSYLTDAFCGDTFDVVKQWPDSRLAKYCHYWNGLHLQHKKEDAKAVESFQIALKYPNFDLAPAARIGLTESLLALGKLSEAGAAIAPFFGKGELVEVATESERLRATTLLRTVDGRIK